MALLTEAERAKRYQYLGYEYTPKGILAFQKEAFPNNPEEHDSIHGQHTDIALRHFYNVKKFCKNFKPEEFRCNCGKCNGYPSYMKQVELAHIQNIRTHYGKPVIITSGLRCATENRRVGGIANSGHLTGYAVDFYQQGVTDTVANRKKSIKWIKKQANHKFTYGAFMYDTDGVYRQAKGMGNAMHTETKEPKVTVYQKMVNWAMKIAADNSYIYVHWKKGDANTKKCPICNNLPKGKYHGWYCTRWVFAPWVHGAKLKKSCGNPPNNGQIEKIYKAKTDAEALRLAREYLGIHDIQVIRNKNGIPKSKVRAGDMCYYFQGSSCVHAWFSIGDNLMIDANSYKDPAKQIAVRKAMSCKVIIRYIGK